MTYVATPLNVPDVYSSTFSARTPTPPRRTRPQATWVFTYDANGNRLSKTGNGASEVIIWDADNRPASISEGGDAATFLYSPDGSRLKKTLQGRTTLTLGADRELSASGVWAKNVHADVKRRITI